jgi:hypothetical protein
MVVEYAHEHGGDMPNDRKKISVKWSPNLTEKDPAKIVCALCQHAPCDCPEFGTPEYFALIDERHGR